MKITKNNREFGIGNNEGRGFESLKANDILTPKHNWSQGKEIHGFKITERNVDDQKPSQRLTVKRVDDKGYIFNNTFLQLWNDKLHFIIKIEKRLRALFYYNPKIHQYNINLIIFWLL